jgi:hypothetical protein
MVEFYLGVAAFAAAFYFLWGVYDPETQQEMEYRWMHTATGSVVETMRFRKPRYVRMRNVIGLAVCLTVLGVALFGRQDSSDRPVGRQPAKKTDAKIEGEMDDIMRREAEKSDAYYRKHSPLGQEP